MAAKKKGGASPYRKGAAHERLVKRAYEAMGWFVMRSPQSASAIDLIALAPQGTPDYAGPHLVQCKLSGRIRPHEREDVIKLATEFGGVPVLAWGTSPICRRDLSTREDLHELSYPG